MNRKAKTSLDNNKKKCNYSFCPYITIFINRKAKSNIDINWESLPIAIANLLKFASIFATFNNIFVSKSVITFTLQSL